MCIRTRAVQKWGKNTEGGVAWFPYCPNQRAVISMLWDSK